MLLEPLIAHAWLIPVENLRMVVIELMPIIIAVEVYIHWVRPQLGADYSSSIF